MKKLAVILVFLGTCFWSFAQDPAIIDDWYLLYTQGDLGDPQSVFDVDPPISPYMIIHQDLTFEGFAACNSFDGKFIYDDVNDLLVLDSFDHSNEPCNFASHTLFENSYFGYFGLGEPYEYFLNSNGELHMEFTTISGFEIVYWPEPILSNEDLSETYISIYPNPTYNILNLSIEGVSPQTIRLFSMSGQLLLFESDIKPSIDISALSPGIYFLDINTEVGPMVKKFIKK